MPIYGRPLRFFHDLLATALVVIIITLAYFMSLIVCISFFFIKFEIWWNDQVHRLACLEVKKITEKIGRIFTALESARPRCKSGLQLLCSLHRSLEKCKLLLRQCSESSKLYLVKFSRSVSKLGPF